MRGDRAPVWGLVDLQRRPDRLLGLFAHPDGEVFCIAGTLGATRSTELTQAAQALGVAM